MGRKILGARAAGLKGQSEIMEYILMVVFIVAAIIGIILFLSWWNIQQIQMQGLTDREGRAVSIAQYMMNDYMLANGGSMFDDAKLTSVNAAGIRCEDLQKIFGTGWYVKITSLDMAGEKKCDWNGYPGCNAWTFCNYQEKPESRSAYNFPVNVYRKVSDKVALAVMHVEVYS